MESAPDAVEVASARRRRLLGGDNALVAAIARVPLPIGAKQFVGTLVVAVLLALVAVLGVVALGQSNSRGEKLFALQRRAVGVQAVLTDATQLKKAIEYRIHSPGSTTTFGSGLDQAIVNDENQLCLDSGLGGSQCGGSPGPFHLAAVDPTAFNTIAAGDSTFSVISGGIDAIPAGSSVESILRRAHRFAASETAQLTQLQERVRLRANALVAADHRSFSRSRALLIGVGAASLALALALGLLLSWSVVTPLRRIRGQLAAIASGHFAERAEVANRDEIGALADDVNRMSGELQRVYRELELASEHKSQFVTNMSHELRTPLNAIIGFSEVLHEQMFGELNERQLAYVNDVLEAGRHLLSLINDVLDLAKIEAGRMELELSRVELPELLGAAVSMHGEQAGRAGVELTLNTEPDEITITADERRVRQIVFNLVSNAVKFTPSGGRIDIGARLENGQVEVTVVDTGAGIAPEDLESIFEEFEQTSEGKQVEGTGLGLPLSRRLVELHGGHLWAESTPGQGSTFRFTLPVDQQANIGNS